MRDSVVVGLAQWLPTPGKPAENLETASRMIHELADLGCDLVVLPELWPCGFDQASLADDVAAAAEPIDGPRTHTLAAAAAERGIWLCAGTVPEHARDGYYNTLILFDRKGGLRATYRKSHLYALLGEDSAVSAGSQLTVCDTEELGTVGLAICFDADFPEVGRTLRAAGARLVIHPSAYERAAESWWDTLYPANALVNGQWWFQANQCGTTRSGTMLGGSRILTPFGQTLKEAVRAHDRENPEPELVVAEVDLRLELERAEREHGALWSLRRVALYDYPTRA